MGLIAEAKWLWITISLAVAALLAGFTTLYLILQIPQEFRWLGTVLMVGCWTFSMCIRDWRK